MGFLDKLLGRGKDAAESAGDTAKDAADKAGETFDDTKPQASGEEELSDIAQSEQRLDDIRDQALRDEGRMP